jgi:hypothetical protein
MRWWGGGMCTVLSRDTTIQQRNRQDCIYLTNTIGVVNKMFCWAAYIGARAEDDLSQPASLKVLDVSHV